jgi:hypothetical protein
MRKVPFSGSRGLLWRRLVISIALAAFTLGTLTVPSAAGSAGPERTVSAAAAPMTVINVPGRRVPQTGRYVPPKIGGGDDDFDGHGPNVDAHAFLDGVFPGSKRLDVSVCLFAKETVSDFTTVNGCSGKVLVYLAPVGECIQSVSTATVDRLRYVDTDHALDTFVGQPGGLVSQWEIVGDLFGSEAGTRTSVDVFTRDITVTSVPC